jgi:LEA14-like dessication related protein
MKKQNKYIGIIVLLGIIISGGVFYVFKNKIVSHFMPDIEQIGEIIIKVKNDTTYVSSSFSVKNKSFINIGIDSIWYKVTLFGKEYLQNHSYIGLTLKSYDVDTIDFAIKIPYVEIVNDLKIEKKKGDSASYSVDAYLQYSSLFGEVEIPINKSARIKIPQPPEISI